MKSFNQKLIPYIFSILRNFKMGRIEVILNRKEDDSWKNNTQLNTLTVEKQKRAIEIGRRIKTM